MTIEVYDARADLAEDFANVHTLHAKYFGPSKPFYWTAPASTGCAPSGWYQWTEAGLIYIGESLLTKYGLTKEK
jgi:hypothetical protein